MVINCLQDEIQYHVAPRKSTDISEENVASIFKAKYSAEQETSSKQTLKMDVVRSSETSVDFERTAWSYILQDVIIVQTIYSNPRMCNDTEARLCMGLLHNVTISRPKHTSHCGNTVTPPCMIK